MPKMSNVSSKAKRLLAWWGARRPKIIRGVSEANIERMLELAKLPEAWGKNVSWW